MYLGSLLSATRQIFYNCWAQLERVNTNWKKEPDSTNHDSSSFYQNQNIEPKWSPFTKNISVLSKICRQNISVPNIVEILYNIVHVKFVKLLFQTLMFPIHFGITHIYGSPCVTCQTKLITKRLFGPFSSFHLK